MKAKGYKEEIDVLLKKGMKLKLEEKEVVYYEDELNDEFSEAKIVPRKIDENYKYFKGRLWDFISLIMQNILSMPIKFFYTKCKFRIKFIGREKLKKAKKTGYFIYGNHTQVMADPFIPSLITYPHRNFYIVNPENISMKGSGWLIELLGAIPVPGNKEAMKHFLDRIEFLAKKNCSISIYPEAHIWPYYTKIRPFKSVSFKYPVKLEKPVYCFTNTYQSYGKNKDKVRIVTYIDGPFYPDTSLKTKEAQEKLRNEVYETMCERSKMSNYEKIKYVKK